MNTNDLLRMLETVLPLFVMLGLGMLCRKKRLFTPEGIAALKFLVVSITLPAVMFSAFAAAEYSASSFIVPASIFLTCAAALALGFGFCRMLGIKGRLTPFLASGFEAGMLGYALFALLFPEESASSFAIIDLGQVLFVFTVYKALLSGGGGIKSVLSDALRSPVIWAVASGLIFGACGIYGALSDLGLNGIIDGITGFAAAPTSAVILLTIGYDLTPGEIQWKSTLCFAGLRAAVMGILFSIVLFVNKTLLNGAMHTGALALMFILPPPFVLPVFARVDSERTNIVSAISALTLLCVLLFAALTFVFA